MKKRILSVLLVVAMLLSMMPTSVFATDTGAMPEETVIPAEPEVSVPVEEPDAEVEAAPETDPAVAEVQAMIDALVVPNTDDYADELAYAAAIEALETALLPIYEAFETFTDAQLTLLTEEDVAKLDAVRTVIHDYRLANIPMAVATTGTKDDPHVRSIDVGATSIDGKTQYEWVTGTLGWKTDKHFYATSVDGSTSIEFTNATGNNFTGYYVTGKENTEIPVGTYKISYHKKEGSTFSPKYNEYDAGYIVIAAAAADATVELNTDMTVALNGYYGPKDEGLAQRIYDAVVKSSNHDGAWTVTVYDGGTLSGWRELDSYMLTTSNFAPGQTKQIRITWAASANFAEKTVEVSSVKLVESRQAPTISFDASKVGSYNTKAEFEAAVKAALTVTDSTGAAITPTVEVTFGDYTFPGEATFTAKVTNAGASWIAGGDMSGKANGVINTYTVTWVDGDGKTLETDEDVPYGTTPAYNGAAPTKASTASTVYTWNNGWEPAVGAITGNTTYTATFDEVAREYTISWDTDGDGAVDKTTEVAYGTQLTEQMAPAAATLPNKSFAGWTPALGVVEGEATYTATYSNDTIYTVTFLVDGEQYGEAQMVNATKGEKIAAVADPDKDYAVFGGWDKADLIGTVPTENVEINATWLTDANNNDVVDTDETVTVTASVEGNGTVDLVANDNITITKNADGTWTVLYNSKVEGANVVIVTATPTDTKSDDGSVDYLVSYDETIDLTAADPVINAVFATKSINVADSGKVYRNGFVTDSYEKLKNLKEDVLAAAGITDDAANYTVYMVTRLGNYNVTSSNFVEQSAMAAAMTVGETQSFKIETVSEPKVSDTISVMIAESRLKLDITASEEAISFEGKTEVEGIQDAVKGLFTITTTDPATGAVTNVDVSDSYVTWSPAYAWPADAETATYTVTVKVNSLANSTYQNAPSDSVTVTLTDTTILYTVTYLDGYNTEDNVVAKYTIAEDLAMQTPDDPTREYYTFAGWMPAVAETVSGDATYTATWTPDLDNNGNGIADQEETYTVVYVLGGEQSSETHANLAWGAALPEAPTPVREGYNFKGWDVDPLPATVAAPAKGNTITYTAVWTQNHVVTFVDRDTTTYIDVENGQPVAEPTTPVWDADHDFVCWMAEDDAGMYDFAQPVTKSMTLTAWWINDFNHNNKDDDTEDHFTVSYDVDGVLTTHADVLVDMPTPAMDDPTKDDYKFVGWEPAVADTVTADVTYVAQWVKDINSNGVDDDEETIAVNVTTAVDGDKVVVSGATAVADGYVYDSTGDGKVTITATPVTKLDGLTTRVSTSYVKLISGAEDVLPEYGSDYSATYAFTAVDGQEINVEFAAAAFAYNEERLLNFYPGMEGIVLDDVYNTIVDTPDLPGEYTMQYFARPASSHTVNLSSLGLPDTIMSVLKLLGQESITIDLPELWLDVEVNDLSDKIENAVSLDQACAQYLTYDRIIGLWDIFQNGGGLTGGGIKAVSAELKLISENITNAAMYYGAHSFGYNATDAEIVTEQIKVTYKSDAMYIEGETTVDLKDLRAASHLLGNNVSVLYRDYTDEELQALIAPYVQEVEGAAITCTDITDPYTFEGKYVSDTAYELTFKFAGNADYKPSEGTFTVTVTKAPASLDVPNTTVTYGEAYNMLDSSYYTLGNQYGDAAEITESMIQFVIGLDVADLDVDQDGVTGLNSRVQLILPDELKSLLDTIISATGGSVEEGVELSLADLVKYLEPIQDTSLDALKQVLNAITSITETGDIKIVLGGDLPTDIGAYLYGAVSTNSNYETAYDVAYIVIKPVTAQAYLQFNYEDSNGIFTKELLKHVDLGVTAYTDETYSTVYPEANELVQSIFLGVDANGEMITTMDPTTLDNGAYTQLGFVIEVGNTVYYAEPIIRPVVITPAVSEVTFVGVDENNMATSVFDGTGKALDVNVTVAGEAVTPAAGELTVTYVGVSSNGTIYNSTEAPVHTGVYTVTATYMGKEENGELAAAGLAVAVLTITPADAQIEVYDAIHTYNGAPYDIAHNLVKVEDAVAADDAKYTLITAMLAADGDVSENGLAGVSGTVNIDFPAALDQILRNNSIFAPGYTEAGINASVVIEAIESRRDEIAALGFGEEALAQIMDLLAQLPDNAKLTFLDGAYPSAVGIYLVAGIITDPDYKVAADYGVLVIAPDAVEGTLAFNYTDSNNVFTQALLAEMKASGMDLNASAYDKAGQFSDEMTALCKNLFIGTDAQGNLVSTEDWTSLSNGTYLQISYIATELSATMYYAAPITRPVVIVPSDATVTFVDENENNAFHFVYDGAAKAVEATVTVNGKTITPAAGELVLTYVGVDGRVQGYYSTEAPTEAGAYTVLATFTRYNADGSIFAAGGAVAAMVIEKAELEFSLEDTVATYDGDGKSTTIVNPLGADYVMVIADRDANILTVNFPAELAALADRLPKDVTVAQLEEALTKAIEALGSLPIASDFAAKLQETLDAIVAELPDATLVINGALPVNAGEYEFYAVTYSANYKSKADSSILTIQKAAPVELPDVPVSQKYSVTTEQTVALGAAGMPNDAGTLTYTKGEAVSTGDAVVAWNVAADGTVTYTVTDGAADEVITLPVKINSDNYEMSVVELVITLADRDVPVITAEDITKTYDGSAITAADITGTAQFNGETVTGTWSFVGEPDLTSANKGLAVTVQFVADDAVNFAPATVNITVTIDQAVPAGEVAYTLIDACNKTLADAALNVGTIKLEGTVAWVDAQGQILADDTLVIAGTAYTYVFTPADTANYDVITGSVILLQPADGMPNGHVLKHVAEQRADCESTGIHAHYKCSVCGKLFWDAAAVLETDAAAVVIPAKSHQLYWVAEVAPACETTGLKGHYACRACDKLFADDQAQTEVTIPTLTIPVTGHDYTAAVTAPTCTEAGYTTHTCGNCQHVYVDGFVDALGHDYEAVVTAPTCTEGGYTTHTCSVCQDSYVDAYVNATGHTWDEGTVTTAPTHEEVGEMTYQCKNCDATMTEGIAALGHDYKAVVTAPTCTEGGYTTYTCVDGDSSYISDRTDALGHSWDEGTITTEPTCTEKGVRTFACANCDETATEEVAATGHSYEAVVTAPTCTEAGYTTYTCAACQDSYKTDYVDATGHDYQAVVTAPTCTAGGYTTYTCSVCQDSYKADYVDAAGHKYQAVVTAPTCTDKGYTTHTCPGCQNTYVDTYVEALGHDWDDGTITKEPTCVEEGEKTYTCARCDETKTEAVPATGEHTYEDGVCTGCGDKQPEEEPPVDPTICDICGGCKDAQCQDHDQKCRMLSMNFKDLEDGKWYMEGIEYVYHREIMKGTSAERFTPDGATNRAMVVTILWRLSGSPAPAGSNPFTDVENGRWFTKAITWAAENGVVEGYGNNKFGPLDSVTREQLAKMFNNYVKFTGGDVSAQADLTGFGDHGQIHGWAKSSMSWAVASGLLNGYKDSTLRPAGATNRAEAATVIMRFCENIAK